MSFRTVAKPLTSTWGRVYAALAMDGTMTVRSKIGDAPKRREDVRFLTGRGRYLDDIAFDGLAHAAILRSPHAHARIAGVDAGAARRAPGVLAVLTAAEIAADGLSAAAAWRRDQHRHR